MPEDNESREETREDTAVKEGWTAQQCPTSTQASDCRGVTVLKQIKRHQSNDTLPAFPISLTEKEKTAILKGQRTVIFQLG